MLIFIQMKKNVTNFETQIVLQSWNVPYFTKLSGNSEGLHGNQTPIFLFTLE